MNALAWFFWLGLFLVFYTYLGYGLVLYVLVRIKEYFFPRKPSVLPVEKPTVALVIAAYNEAAVVHEKMKNCNALVYPDDMFRIYWVTDGSNDSTNELLAAYPNATVLFQPERQGKTAALNRAMPYIDADITVFTDANTELNPEAIEEIVHRFSEASVGCVAGEKRVRGAIDDAVANEGLYWKYESLLKRLDDRLYSAVGAAGELFAIRTPLFEKMPHDTLLDDFVLSLRIAQKGYKIAYCDTAYALEDPSANMQEEAKRKVRIAAGGLQSIVRLSALLNPFRYGVLSFQYISHRVLRWSLTPFVLFALFPVNVWLVLAGAEPVWLYLLAMCFQLLFYGMAWLGYERSKKDRKGFYVPYYFLFMNVNVLKGFRYLQQRKGTGVWEKATRKA